MHSPASPTPGKRSLDAEINLVPFIDLLSMCICFLLMTAVWFQMESVQIKQNVGTESPEGTGLELSLHFQSASELAILLQREGKIVKKLSIKGTDTKDAIAQLYPVLAEISDPKSTAITSARIVPVKEVPYGSLISVLDALRKHQIINVGVIPQAG